MKTNKKINRRDFIKKISLLAISITVGGWLGNLVNINEKEVTVVGYGESGYGV